MDKLYLSAALCGAGGRLRGFYPHSLRHTALSHQPRPQSSFQTSLEHNVVRTPPSEPQPRLLLPRSVPSEAQCVCPSRHGLWSSPEPPRTETAPCSKGTSPESAGPRRLSFPGRPRERSLFRGRLWRDRAVGSSPTSGSRAESAPVELRGHSVKAFLDINCEKTVLTFIYEHYKVSLQSDKLLTVFNKLTIF